MSITKTTADTAPKITTRLGRPTFPISKTNLRIRISQFFWLSVCAAMLVMHLRTGSFFQTETSQWTRLGWLVGAALVLGLVTRRAFRKDVTMGGKDTLVVRDLLVLVRPHRGYRLHLRDTFGRPNATAVFGFIVLMSLTMGLVVLTVLPISGLAHVSSLAYGGFAIYKMLSIKVPAAPKAEPAPMVTDPRPSRRKSPVTA